MIRGRSKKAFYGLLKIASLVIIAMCVMAPSC